MWVRTTRPGQAEPIKALRGTEDDLRAMKRALAQAPLGPKATLALSAAIIALEDQFERRPAPTAADPR